MRLALGPHPLNAELHSDKELVRVKELVDETSFIGEIGLDFSREGYETRDKQLNSFRFVLQSLRNQPNLSRSIRGGLRVRFWSCCSRNIRIRLSFIGIPGRLRI
jgi:hypothetical protein